MREGCGDGTLMVSFCVSGVYSISMDDFWRERYDCSEEKDDRDVI